MSEERSQFAQRVDERKFGISRRGYDKREVRDYLEDLEQAFREMEGHLRRTTQKVTGLERDLSKARATEKVSVDNAMMAVFDAKDRILERARRRATEIEDQANLEAIRIRNTAVGDVAAGDAAAGEIAAARAQADEIVAAARREADRLREEVQSSESEDSAADIVALTAQLQRAHGDSAAVRKELDVARNRIVELEHEMEQSGPADLAERFAELEARVESAGEEAEELRRQLAAERDQAEELRVRVAAADETEAAQTALLGEMRARVAAADEADTARTDKAARLDEMQTTLAAANAEVESLRTGAAAFDEVRSDLESQLAGARSQVEALEGEATSLRTELDEVRQLNDATDISQQAIAQLETAVADQVVQAQAASFAVRMMAAESQLTRANDHATAVALVAELGRGAIGGPNVPGDGEPDPVSVASQLADATAEVETMLIAAREEAEAIKEQAADEAEQRAAKVIARAREEADQVRETVSTLTAQAEDARSAALRSKMEADDLVDAQRAMGKARDDIIAAAEARAASVQEDAERAAKATRKEADRLLTEAQQEAARLAAEAEEAARVRRSAVEEELAVLLTEAKTKTAPTGAAPPPAASLQAVDRTGSDDLAALLAEAELEVANSEELRRQRRSLDEREAELFELERMAEAKRAEAERILEPMSDDPVAPGIGSQQPLGATPATEASSPVPDTPLDDDPAERLSALLEQVAPSVGSGVAHSLDGEPNSSAGDGSTLDLEELADEAPDEAPDDVPRPRVAWPTPVNDDEADLDEDGKPRESRYRSRSARLPRLGTQAKSNMTTMANLRKKSRGVNDR